MHVSAPRTLSSGALGAKPRWKIFSSAFSTCREKTPILSLFVECCLFSDVCPEPVLVNSRSFLSLKRLKKERDAFFAPPRPPFVPPDSAPPGATRRSDRRLCPIQDKTRQEQARQDKTITGKTRQEQEDKTRQHTLVSMSCPSGA